MGGGGGVVVGGGWKGVEVVISWGVNPFFRLVPSPSSSVLLLLFLS